jgi:Glycosyltransferase WbsX
MAHYRFEWLLGEYALRLRPLALPCKVLPRRFQPAAAPEVVAIYFPGYHQDDHYDSWFGEGWNEWQLLAEAPARFPGHRFLRPAWGAFDEANANWMARQVALAADHGIDVFLFDWYWYSGVRILYRPLEQAFLQATNQGRLKFALMWANHDWKNYFPVPKDKEPALLLPSRTSADDFGRLMDYCSTNYFSRSNYWRVDRGLYFGVFEADKFVKQLGGPRPARQVLDKVRQKLRAAGLGTLHMGAFLGAPYTISSLRQAGFDSITTYNVTASGKASLPGQPLDNYSHLVDRHPTFWKGMDTGELPYYPILTLGWDPSPRWAKDAPFPPTRSDYPYGTLVVSNTPAEFDRLCRLARQHVNQARIRPPAIVVNAWNEWTEGSALLPSVEHGTNYLDILSQSFSR